MIAFDYTKRVWSLALILGLAHVLAAQIAMSAEAAFAISHKLPLGETNVFRESWISDAVSRFPPSTQTTSNHIELISEYTVAIPETSRQSYYSVMVTIGPFSYTSWRDGILTKRMDSKKDKSSDIGFQGRPDILRSFVGRTLKGRMSESGTIDVGESFLNVYSRADPPLSDDEVNVVKSLFSKLSINIFDQFPKKDAYRVGETFTRNTQKDFGKGLKSNGTVKGVVVGLTNLDNRPLVLIVEEGTLSMTLSASMLSMRVKDAKTKAHYLFDPRLSMFVQTTSSCVMIWDIEVEGEHRDMITEQHDVTTINKSRGSLRSQDR
jgi:hypothetical protein